MERKKSLFNPIILLLTTLVALSGIIVGVLYAKNSPDAQEILRQTELFSDNFQGVFYKALQKNFFWTALYLLSGISIFLIPVTVAAVFAKSYSFGFTAGCLVAVMELNEYLTLISGVVFHNFLYAMFYVFYSAYGINKSFESFLNRRNYDYKVQRNKRFIIVSIIAMLLNIIISFLEAYISVRLYEI